MNFEVLGKKIKINVNIIKITKKESLKAKTKNITKNKINKKLNNFKIKIKLHKIF